jgi:hypothetical protein
LAKSWGRASIPFDRPFTNGQCSFRMKYLAVLTPVRTTGQARVAEWQTRWIQNPVPARACRFKSGLWYYGADRCKLRQSDAKSPVFRGFSRFLGEASFRAIECKLCKLIPFCTYERQPVWHQFGHRSAPPWAPQSGRIGSKVQCDKRASLAAGLAAHESHSTSASRWMSATQSVGGRTPPPALVRPSQWVLLSETCRTGCNGPGVFAKQSAMSPTAAHHETT